VMVIRKHSNRWKKVEELRRQVTKKCLLECQKVPLKLKSTFKSEGEQEPN
jgi:hypothetical protein